MADLRGISSAYSERRGRNTRKVAPPDARTRTPSGFPMIRSCSRNPLCPCAFAPARSLTRRRFCVLSSRRTISPSASGLADTGQPYQAQPAYARTALLDDERVRLAYLGV